jgi:hypothetical protein
MRHIATAITRVPPKEELVAKPVARQPALFPKTYRLFSRSLWYCDLFGTAP